MIHISVQKGNLTSPWQVQRTYHEDHKNRHWLETCFTCDGGKSRNTHLQLMAGSSIYCNSKLPLFCVLHRFHHNQWRPSSSSPLGLSLSFSLPSCLLTLCCFQPWPGPSRLRIKTPCKLLASG